MLKVEFLNRWIMPGLWIPLHPRTLGSPDTFKDAMSDLNHIRMIHGDTSPCSRE